MKDEMIPNNGKNNCAKTGTNFANLYAMWKACSEDCATENGFESVATHTALPSSFVNASLN